MYIIYIYFKYNYCICSYHKIPLKMMIYSNDFGCTLHVKIIFDFIIQ